MSTADLPDGFVQYLRERQLQRRADVYAAWGRLSEREQRLVREAAVMGFIHGNMLRPGWATSDVAFPSDTEIVATVIDACLVHADRYPTIANRQENIDPCGCCEICDYAAPEDDVETACENCGHSPEEYGET